MIPQVVQLITGFIDTIMMGRMGTEILAADGFAALIFISIMIITSSIVMGVSPLIAEAFDAEQKHVSSQLSLRDCGRFWSQFWS